MLTSTRSILKASAVTLSLAQLFSGSVAHAAPPTGAAYSLKEVELFDYLDLLEARQVCAMGKMPEVKRKTEAHRLTTTKLPDTDVYCLKVLAVTGTQKRWADLYMQLAIQEQGFSSFDFAERDRYLGNNESGRTMAAILQAANAGLATYTSITGKPRALPCPLALDAGETWASSAASAKAPVALTPAAAATIARQCYDPAVTSITVNGVAMPAQKAGLLAGAWLAKN